LKLPLSVTEPVQGLYDAIEAVPEGAIVLAACDYDPGSMPELYPMNLTAFRQLFRRNIRVVCTSLWPACPPLVEQALKTVALDEFHKTYGVDFVNLGFKEGREVVMVEMGNSIPKTFPKDFYGTPVEELPLMREVTNFADLAMIVNISAGYPGTKEWVQQVRSRFDIPLGAGSTAVSAPEYYPYVQAGQLTGLLGGLKGAAEYETLVQVPGTATSGMDAQSIVHLVIIIMIVFGNVLFLINKRRRERQMEGW
jgi:hypothetical protein